MRARAGTLAGTSLADLVFTRVVSRVLGNLRARIRESGLEYKFPLHRLSVVLGLVPRESVGRLSNVLGEASYADDSVFLVFGSSHEVVRKLFVSCSSFMRFSLDWPKTQHA